MAAAIAEAQKESLAEALDTTLATKSDIAELRHEMRELRTEVSGKFTLLQWMLAALIAIAIANFAKQFSNPPGRRFQSTSSSGNSRQICFAAPGIASFIAAGSANMPPRPAAQSMPML